MPVDDEEPDDDEELRPKSRASKKALAPRKGPGVVIIAGAVVLVLGLGAAGAFFSGLFDAKPEPNRPNANLAPKPPGPQSPNPRPQPPPNPNPNPNPNPTLQDTDMPRRDPAGEAVRKEERARKLAKLAIAEQQIIAALGQTDAARAAAGDGLAFLGKHRNQVLQVAFAPDGQLLASASSDGSAKLWDLRTGTVKHHLPGHGQCGHVAFSPDGQTLAATTQTNKIRLWDVQTGQLRHDVEAKNGGGWHGVAFTPDGRVPLRQRIRIRALGRKNRDSSHCPLGHRDTRKLSFRPDGKVFASITDNQIGFWNLETGVQYRKAFPVANWFTEIAYSPSGWTMGILSRVGTNPSLTFRDIDSGKEFPTTVDAESFHSIVFSPDGKWVALGGAEDAGAGKVHLWELAAGKAKAGIESSDLGLVQALAFSPGGTMLATGDGSGRVRLWTVADILASVPRPKIPPDLAELITVKHTTKTLAVSLGSKATDAVMPQLAKLNGLTDLELDLEDSPNLTEKAFMGLKDLKDLRRLHVLKATKVTDGWLAHLKVMTNLTGLTLSGCETVTNVGIAQLTSLSNMETLELRATGVTGDVLVNLKKLPRLRILLLSDCDFTPEALENLAGLTQLTELELSGAGINDAKLAHFKGMPNLKHLDLSRNVGLTGAGLTQLKDLPALRELNLFDTGLTDAGLGSLKDLPKLTQLILGGPAMTVTDAGFANLAGLLDLTSLGVRGLKGLKGEGLKHLKDLHKLTRLDLRYTFVTDDGLVGIKDLLQLKELILPHNTTDAGFVHLAGLVQLQKLDVVELDGFTGAGLKHLEKLTGLTELELRFTGVTDAGLANLKGLTHLRSLDLSVTKVTDACLVHLYGLKNLQDVVVSDTKITQEGKAALVKALPQARVR